MTGGSRCGPNGPQGLRRPRQPAFLEVRRRPEGVLPRDRRSNRKRSRAHTEPVWHLSYFGQRAVRSTLVARECDLYIGLPVRRRVHGRPAPVCPSRSQSSRMRWCCRGIHVEGLADLRGRRVAVQFASPPQSLLATVEDVLTVTVLSPEEGMRALADGRADAAYLWGPSAGYLNKYVYDGRYQMVPTEGQAMSWHVAIGFRREDRTLREHSAIRARHARPVDSERSRAKYGFPSGAPVRVAGATGDRPARTGRSHRECRAARRSGGAHGDLSIPPPLRAVTRCSTANCCPLPRHRMQRRPRTRTDLRRLHRRYGAQTDEVFSTTVHNGRPEKGMPRWKGVLSEDDIAAVKAYIDSVQQSN